MLLTWTGVGSHCSCGKGPSRCGYESASRSELEAEPRAQHQGWIAARERAIYVLQVGCQIGPGGERERVIGLDAPLVVKAVGQALVAGVDRIVPGAEAVVGAAGARAFAA